jgi:hypothetical protein
MSSLLADCFASMAITPCEICGSAGSPHQCLAKLVEFALDPAATHISLMKSDDELMPILRHLSETVYRADCSIQLHDALYDLISRVFEHACWQKQAPPLYDLDPSRCALWNYAADRCIESPWPRREILHVLICRLLLYLLIEQPHLVGVRFNFVALRIHSATKRM